MSNIIEYKNKLAIHPGYYINEQIELLDISQEDFAKKLDTTPKNLSKLINGEQSLSFEMALKLSKMLGTSVEGWLNLQIAFDWTLADIHFELELDKERKLLKALNYDYFTQNYNLNKDEKVTDYKLSNVRELLKVANLLVLKKEDLSTSFKKSLEDKSEMDIVRANIMTQLAINAAAEIDAPIYNKTKLLKACKEILKIKYDKNTILKVKEILLKTGVKLVIIPHYPKAKVKGACKRTNKSIVLMISDKYISEDKFYPTLFHEIGHIINGDLGISSNNDKGSKEELADSFARKMLSQV